MFMFKTVIAPVQAWLLSRGQCVGCGTMLKKGKQSKKDTNTTKVICRCGRIFMKDNKSGEIRRALFSEI